MYIEISKKASKKFTTYIKQMDKIYLEYDFKQFYSLFYFNMQSILNTFFGRKKSLIFYILLKF